MRDALSEEKIRELRSQEVRWGDVYTSLIACPAVIANTPVSGKRVEIARVPDVPRVWQVTLAALWLNADAAFAIDPTATVACGFQVSQGTGSSTIKRTQLLTLTTAAPFAVVDLCLPAEVLAVDGQAVVLWPADATALVNQVELHVQVAPYTRLRADS